MGGIVISGSARHGKDTVAEYLRDRLGLTFESSSMFCARKFIFDAIKGSLGYSTLDECFEDRVNHRALWASLISSYNHKDPSRLSREIFAEYDIYVGIRSTFELEAAKEEGLVNLVIWVDASERHPVEPADSFDIGIESVDIMINNSGTELQLIHRLDNLIDLFGRHKGKPDVRVGRVRDHRPAEDDS